MSLWNVLNDSLAALNAIGQVLSSIPELLMSILTNGFMLLWYPAYVMVNVIVYDINWIWEPFALLWNDMLLIAYIPYTLLTTIMALPPTWTFLIMTQITISMWVRYYRWIKEIRGWVLTMSGDN